MQGSEITTVVVRFTARDGQVEALRRMIAPAIPRLAELPGCRGGSLYYDIDEPRVFVLIEHWESAEAHRAYLRRLDEDGTMERMLTLLASPPDRRYLGAHG